MAVMRHTIFAALLLCPALAHAQRDLANIPDPDPEVERRSFVVADGFEVNLFAADPILAKPIQINFDPKGRLWVASSEVYPQIKPGQVANDKVLIVEDTDGDGRADKTTVFADGLLIPTGVEPGDGGAYVANSTELLHLKDTDGDGRADTRRVVLSGFGTEDTHHILHTLKWGWDGNLYMNQSIYIHSHIETPHGVRRLGGGGIWRLRPETLELDVFIKGLVNPWGHAVDRWGQSFATDGAGGEGINYALPGAYYFTAPDAAKILKGLNPGSPKHCGAEIVGGRHLPDSWQGSILTNDFRANRVCRFVLSDDGSGFSSREQPELLKTPHVAFRPIDVKQGPDGAIYVADWYNPIIQHGEVDFRDPRRDHTRGRIWRITAKGRPLVEKPKLADANINLLLDALKSPEDYTRQQAKRVLKERGPSVLPILAAWTRAIDPADPQAEHLRLEALWTYQALDAPEPALLAALLRSADFRVRAAAVRVVQPWAARLSGPMALLADRVVDEHPRVRLEAVRVLASLPSAESANIAMRALDYPTDRFLDYALWLTARELAPQWLPALEAGTLDFGGDPKKLLFAMEAAGSPRVAGPLVASIRAGKVPAGRRADVLKLIATVGQPDDLKQVFNLATEDMSIRALALTALADAAKSRGLVPSGGLPGVDRLINEGDDASRAAACRAAGAWKMEGVRPLMEALVGDTKAADIARAAAVDGLASLGGPQALMALERFAHSDSSAVRRAAIAAIEPSTGARLAVDELAKLSPGDDPSPLFATFLGRKGGPAALASALADTKLPADVAKLGVRLARQSGRVDESLVAALTKAGGITGAAVVLSAEELDAFVAEVRTKGDAPRGEAVFRRTDQQCLKCHAVAGAGGQVGPGLESIGASAPVDYLVASILQPDKAIKENYQTLVVATKDGKIVSGIKLRQTDADLLLRDAEGVELSIPLASIEEQKNGGSLMPAGLVDNLTRPELVDLIRFLSEMGKVGPYAVGQARVVRRWRVLEPTKAAYLALNREGTTTAVKPHPDWTWSPAYSAVGGTLPIAAVPGFVPNVTAPREGFAQAQLDVSTAGAVRIGINEPTGLEFWIDGVRVDPKAAIDIDLKSGVHTLTFAIDQDKRREPLRVELLDAPGSMARATVVGGR